MAVVTYSPEYSDITDWPGGLLEGTGTTSFTSKSATSATLKHGSGHNFANYTIKFSGSGFTYDGNTGAWSSWEPRVADPRGRSFTVGVEVKF